MIFVDRLFFRSFFFESSYTELLLRYYIASIRSYVKVQANSRFPKQVHDFTVRGEEKRRREMRRFAAESRSRCRSRSTRKGRGDLLPTRGRQSGFSLGNTRARNDDDYSGETRAAEQ